jgi:DNA repair exonuclease SbcCD ATPase subunit
MKISSISLQNFANYEQITASFDQNVTYLIGKNGAGKSTLGITAIWFMFQGIAEKASAGTPTPLNGERFRFIGDNAATAKGEMILTDNGRQIKVTRKLTKTGSELSFTGPDTMHLSQKWLTDLFNVYLIAPKKFLDLSGKDQAKVLGIDTTEYDAALATLKQQATFINRDIKNYGELTPVEEVERVDVTALQARKDVIRGELNAIWSKNKVTNDEARKKWLGECEEERVRVEQFNSKQLDKKAAIINKKTAYNEIDGLINDYDLAEFINLDALKKHIEQLPYPDNHLTYTAPPEPTYIPEKPDDAPLQAIDAEIAQAFETNAKADAYKAYTVKVQSRDALLQNAETNKNLQYAQTKKRLDYIKTFELPYDGLEISDDGDLLLDGKPLREPYFSTGELLKMVPTLMAVTNPELKYVFLQDFNLLDEDAQAEIETYLVERGFQLVIELVGKETILDKNCIVLRDGVVATA